jgi:hypothetical protein
MKNQDKDLLSFYSEKTCEITLLKLILIKKNGVQHYKDFIWKKHVY